LLFNGNQSGSISHSVAAVVKSKKSGWGVETSHFLGESEDTYIADFAVGLRTEQINTGAQYWLERLIK
jgi:enolase